MALLSLGFLLLAIMLGFIRKMNTGLLCIAFALLLGRMAGISDAEIIKGFNASLFLMLLGVTYLFSLAQINGSLDLLAQKVISLAGKRVYLIPIIIYVFSIILAALGPGSVPTMAIMMVFSMSLAAEMKISPVLLSTLTVLGSCAGGLSPLAATGIIGANLCAEFGLTGIENDFLMNGILSFTIYAVIVYILLGGYKLRSAAVEQKKEVPCFNKRQLTTIAGIIVMVLMVMLLRINVGLVSFAVAAVLSFLRVSDETKAIKHIPWNTLLLITGIDLGGIEVLSNVLVSLMSAKSAAAVMGLTSGIMSWFSSSSGVVMPTLLPTVPHVAQQLGGVNEFELASSITTISHVAAISPLSTGGALALAAYASAANANQKQQQNLFMKMFGVSALGVSVLCVFSYFGMFHWLL